MNKTTRMLAMSGIAIAAGLTMGVGPASAAPSATASPSATTSKSSTADHRFDRNRERVVGFYRSPRDCAKAGKVGEWRKKWDNYDCDRVFRGFQRGKWALKVSWDRKGPQFPGHGHVKPGHGHIKPGHGHIKPGHGHVKPGIPGHPGNHQGPRR